jgi:hypothetical protein
MVIRIETRSENPTASNVISGAGSKLEEKIDGLLGIQEE